MTIKSKKKKKTSLKTNTSLHHIWCKACVYVSCMTAGKLCISRGLLQGVEKNGKHSSKRGNTPLPMCSHTQLPSQQQREHTFLFMFTDRSRTLGKKGKKKYMVLSTYFLFFPHVFTLERTRDSVYDTNPLLSIYQYWRCN